MSGGRLGTSASVPTSRCPRVTLSGNQPFVVPFTGGTGKYAKLKSGKVTSVSYNEKSDKRTSPSATPSR